MVSYDEALELRELEDSIQRTSEDSDTLVTDSPTDKDNDNLTSTTRNPENHQKARPRFLDNFIHVVQFCHLCAKGKIPAIHYKLTSSPEIMKWFIDTMASYGIDNNNKSKRPIELEDNDSDSEVNSNQGHKVSRTDQHLLKTILKINDNIDKQSLRTQKEREGKEPGFARLESYRKSLILNASAVPPHDSPADIPTEFYNMFLSKKTQFKAKEALAHRLLLDKVSFNPGAAFVTCLWHTEFFWVLPDSPSGISLFFCP